MYDSPHLGHARTYVAFDVIVRYLIYKGYHVKHVVNITDIDDKIINRAQELNVPPESLAAKYQKMFLDDVEALGIMNASVYPKVSEHIPDIIKVISSLINQGYAYTANGDVYFDVTKKHDIGKLSRQSLDEIKAGARVEINERKRNPADFALWKAAKDKEPFWESPFGQRKTRLAY